MRFGSAASGIEAASVAWKPLGLEPAWYSEIDRFCCALLNERHGETPNLGDMNEITTHALRKCGPIDILVAGTPCQAFSVAGQRGGLRDPRGQLALRLLELLEWTRPQWLVWENVPGVLSSGKGFDFAAFLWALAVRGYGFAWRVFDAQFSGVPQRRRRVFLVGHLGDWTRAASILFEPESLPGNLATGSKTKQDVAGTVTAGSGRRRGAGVNPGEIVSDVYAIQERAVSENINNGPQGLGIQERIAYTLEARHHVQAVCHAFRTTGNCGAWETGDKIDTLTTGTDPCSHLVMAHGQAGAEVIAGQCLTLTCNHEAPILFDTTQITSPGNYSNPQPGGPCHPLAAGAHPPAMAFAVHAENSNAMTGAGNAAVANEISRARCLDTTGGYAHSQGGTVVLQRAVRRLTPRECERLMGLPDDYTLITYRGKPAADGPRYKAIGNSIAIPDLRWIGQRILNANG